MLLVGLADNSLHDLIGHIIVDVADQSKNWCIIANKNYGNLSRYG